MRNNDKYTYFTSSSDKAMCLGMLLLLLFIGIVVNPFLVYWCCYFDGWVASKIIGVPLCNSLNYVFGTNITPNALPKIAGVLGWIGSFFKNSAAVANKLNSMRDKN